ncbi:peptidyl-prolyl cis-trans isomerase cyp5-like [Limulus polyphemus]|uniref:Peptidyl-prolyl cis-trans isomerase n=1 Tax=Limulus polyphemus TaxID=6850 RepID=A0ABM1SCS9_LIMPO|nr:peptidyl-prolyl cis-trans isomerase cyp5-like [Limulus polyphemus]
MVLNDTSHFNLQLLQEKTLDVHVTTEYRGMLEWEWLNFLEKLQQEALKSAWLIKGTAAVWVNGEFVGHGADFVDWLSRMFEFEGDIFEDCIFKDKAEKDYQQYFCTSNHEFVYMDIADDNKMIGRLIFELFTDLTPKTCQNFKALCTGEYGTAPSGVILNYKKSPIHRIVPNGWIQGGDIVGGKGNGGESIFGAIFGDESFAIKHNTKGVLGMANKGRNSNASQFYITLCATPWMNKVYVAFGQVIEGFGVLEALTKLDTLHERPLANVYIANCGLVTFDCENRLV